ncbi:hypothetical protein QAD02_013320 [Eretmocerus hayati]|uniref:Uncharacterized protein n=1 Tax=Eretmocerus hayati TaxID=131215 RepID=A0ACC2P353_9HYME|nr:hypothetical protein QAD02_013320 [Eretmocerus hayati]
MRRQNKVETARACSKQDEKDAHPEIPPTWMGPRRTQAKQADGRLHQKQRHRFPASVIVSAPPKPFCSEKTSSDSKCPILSAALGRAPSYETTDVLNLSTRDFPPLPSQISSNTPDVQTTWCEEKPIFKQEDFPPLPSHQEVPDAPKKRVQRYTLFQEESSQQPTSIQTTTTPIQGYRPKHHKRTPSPGMRISHNQDMINWPPMTEMPVSAERHLKRALDAELCFIQKDECGDMPPPVKSMKVITASSLLQEANKKAKNYSKYWPNDQAVYHQQPPMPERNSPPWSRYNRPPEYHVLGPIALANYEIMMERKRIQDLVDNSQLRPTADEWFPQSHQNIHLPTEPYFSPTERLAPYERAGLTKLPHYVPQFGIEQYKFPKAPTSQEEFNTTIKPSIIGYLRGEEKLIFEASSCVQVSIWIPPTTDFWVCYKCYKYAAGWDLVPIHRVGLKAYHHNPQCPACGEIPYKIQEVVKCRECKRVGHNHLDDIRAGVVVSCHPPTTRFDLSLHSINSQSLEVRNRNKPNRSLSR